MRTLAVAVGAIIGSAAALDCTSFSAGDAEQVSDGGVETTDGRPGLDAAVDSGTTADGGCNARFDCERRVFITKDTFTAALGGIDGADTKCNDAANAADASPLVKGRRYLAFLSDSTTAAAVRLPPGMWAYTLPMGDVVQRGSKELLTGLLKPIAEEEHGLRPGTFNVWTGSNADGSSGPRPCANWLSSDASGAAAVGSGSVVDPGWIFSDHQYCSERAHLYCFEF